MTDQWIAHTGADYSVVMAPGENTENASIQLFGVASSGLAISLANMLNGDQASFAQLRFANLSRCARWHPGGLSDWSLSDWGVAMAGEAGELLNVIKKLNRERDGIAGNTLSEAGLREQLADQIADVAIYLDILAASEGIDLSAAIVRKFNATSVKVGFPERLSPMAQGSTREDFAREE